MKEIDLSKYDVTVVSGILLSSRIFGVGTYRAPVDSTLLNFAKTQVEEKSPKAYFSLDGDRVNPFLLMEDLEIPHDEPSNVDDISSMFKSVDEFGSMSDKSQVAYINSIKDIPSDLNEESADEYDKELYNQLVAYKEVSKKKALVEVESVLALYE